MLNYLMGDKPIFSNGKYYSCGNPLHCGIRMAIKLNNYFVNGRIEVDKKDYFFTNDFFRINLKDLKENVYFIEE